MHSLKNNGKFNGKFALGLLILLLVLLLNVTAYACYNDKQCEGISCNFFPANKLCNLNEKFCYCALATCGNLKCEEGETYDNCPYDCVVGCGDGSCSQTENSRVCPTDCPPVCGNGYCEEGESSSNCPEDCFFNLECCESEIDAYLGEIICISWCPICGDNQCEEDKGENCLTCSFDCGICSCEDQGGVICREDQWCAGEWLTASDTKRCCSTTCTSEEPEFCGDGKIQENENCANCPEDVQCKEGQLCCGMECIVPACTTDNDCDDNRTCTVDKCEKPNTCDAKCVFEETPDCEKKEKPEIKQFDFELDYEPELYIGATQQIVVRDTTTHEPLEGVKVVVSFPNRESYFAFSNEQGIVSFGVDLVGNYSLEAEKNNIIKKGVFTVFDLFSSIFVQINQVLRALFGPATDTPWLLFLLLLLCLIDAILAFNKFKRFFSKKQKSTKKISKEKFLRLLVAAIFFIFPLIINILTDVNWAIIVAFGEMAFILLTDYYFKRKDAKKFAPVKKAKLRISSEKEESEF